MLSFIATRFSFILVAIAAALLATSTVPAIAQPPSDYVTELLTLCDRGDAESCAYAASLHERGDRVPVDLVRAAELLRQACDLGYDRGCLSLAGAYREGAGVDQDEAEARRLVQRGQELLTTACEGGNGRKCLELGFYYLFDDTGLIGPDSAKAREVLLRGCDLLDGNSCILAADIYSFGLGVARDPQKARELTTKGCDLGADECRLNLPSRQLR